MDITERSRPRRPRDADRRKDEFLRPCHELRNPLAPLRNGLQVMSWRAATEAIEQARSMMERQLGRWSGWSTTCST